MSYSQSWLDSPSAIGIVLVIVNAYNVQTTTTVPFYFSNSGYVTTDGVVFNPIIANKIGLEESISDDGSTSMSFGDIEIHNLNGELDNLLDSTKYIWSNRSIKVYYGDPGWNYSLSQISSTFLTIFDGIIDDIDSRVNKSINFKIRDKLERLNTPITQNKIGTYGVWPSGQQNKDTVRPVVFGEVFNISPILINPATLEYCFSSSNPDQVADSLQTVTFANNGESERLIEVRDNGVPIYNSSITGGATVDLATSTFKLTKSPAGTITCSVQGVKKSVTLTQGAQEGTLTNTYTNNIPSLIAVIVTQFGKAGSRLTASEIDFATFRSFDDTAEIGIIVNETQTVLSACREICDSLGGQLIMNRVGKLRLIRYGIPLPISIIASRNITVNDILYDSLNIVNKLQVKSASKIGYAKNYTIQNNLLTNIPSEHKTSYETEWLTTTSTDSTVNSLYLLEADVRQKDTSLISQTDAQAEALRLRDYYKVQRIIYRFIGKSSLLSLELGQQVVLYHHRFGLDSGKTGQVVKLSPNWSNQTIEVEVIV